MGSALDTVNAFYEALAERIRIALRGRTDVAERKMFGGLTFMVPAGWLWVWSMTT